MFGLGKLILDKCEKITTVADGVATTKYVLYKKDGTEVVIGQKKSNVDVIDSKIADLQAEKDIIVNLKSISIEKEV